jgi:hypothetical protein
VTKVCPGTKVPWKEKEEKQACHGRRTNVKIKYSLQSGNGTPKVMVRIFGE